MNLQTFFAKEFSYQTTSKVVELHGCLAWGCLNITPHLSIEQIKERLYSCKSGHASYWQIILTLSLTPGKKAKDYASLLVAVRENFTASVLYTTNKVQPLQTNSHREADESRAVY